MPKLTPEQQKLAEENHNLIYSVLREYGLSEDDYYDFVAIILCEAARQFDETKGYAFSTYFYKAVKNGLCSERKHRERKGRIPNENLLYYQGFISESEEIVTEDCLSFLKAPENPESEAIFNVFFEKYIKTVNKKARTILLLTKNGFSQTEISDKVLCSRAYVYLVRKKFAEKARKELLW